MVTAFVPWDLTRQNIILCSIVYLKKSLRHRKEDTVEKRLEELIQLMKKTGALSDKKVEEAIRKAPRHLFVPSKYVGSAYEDIPLQSKMGQTISQPSVVARMTQWLDVKEGHNVLEIGCGSGWQSAILSNLVGKQKVYSIERISEIVEFAKNNHNKADIKNVEIIHADGTLGLEEKSPFDRIIITAACAKIPQVLLDQLSEDGLIIAPVGENTQSMTLLRKTSQGIREEKKEYGYIFVPLIDKSNFKN